MNFQEPQVAVSVRDIVGFIACAAIDLLIAVGMYAVAPEGIGRAIGVAFALALLPLPVVVAYVMRRRKRVKV
jgi:hypothetical protein